MAIDPTAALRSAGAPAPSRRREGARRLRVAGAVGRLGEALLNEALARGGYDEVVALSEGDATMNLGLRGLSLAPVTALPVRYGSIERPADHRYPRRDRPQRPLQSQLLGAGRGRTGEGHRHRHQESHPASSAGWSRLRSA
jgi:hypothetical protein